MSSAFLLLPRDLLYFPIWWYTRGFLRFAKSFGQALHFKWQELGVGIWVKNLFVPMFGERDMAGRLISFFVRLANIIIRFLIFLFYILFFSIVFLLKLFAPLAFGILFFIQIWNILN